MHPFLSRPLLLAVAVLAFPSIGTATILETSVPPTGAEKYKSADFRLWIPEGVKHVRGVIVRQHGCGRNGIDQAEDVQWQALARQWDCALLGTHFQVTKECADWFLPTNGSERALLVALKTFADKSKHPELMDAPWVLWGHSGGALWSMHLAYRHPERVIAVFARSQAVTGPAGKALQVPMLLSYGVQEMTGRFESVHKNSVATLATNRPLGALWGQAVDPKSSHDCRNARHLAIPFFDAVLAQRLPPVPDKQGPVVLRSMDAKKAWLGNPETLEVAAEAAFQGDKAKAAWLPDEATARRWQEFCKTGSVADTTPPPAPTAVLAKVDKDGIHLTWQAVADLESGIKRFHVYRDGKKVGTVGGAVTKANKEGYYQIWNYGDEPEPRPGAMQYLDKGGNRADRYEVVTENHAGLLSARSVAKAVAP